MGTRLSNMRTTYWKLTGRGLNDGTAEPQKIKYIALVANKQICLFWLSESFQIPYEDVDWSRRLVLLSRLFQLLIIRSEMVFQVRLIDFFSALEVFYENALYKFTFDIW